MRPQLTVQRVWPKIVGGAALGAMAAYVLDPYRGKRRRAIFRDKARSALLHMQHLARVSARDLRHRVQGLLAAPRPFVRSGVPDDLVLIERARAKMGRVVSHPHAIQIGALNGRIMLSGPILASEAKSVLDTVRLVWGVVEVEDHLVRYERPESIPSLQGGGTRGATRPELWQESWTPALRMTVVLAGSALAICAMRQRGLTRLALGMVGLGLSARAAANVPLKRLASFSRSRPDRDTKDPAHRHTATNAGCAVEDLR